MGEAQLRLSTTTWDKRKPLWSPTEATQANRSNTRMKLLASFLLVLLSSSVVSCHVQEQEPTRKLQQTAGNPFPLPLEGAFSQFWSEFFDQYGDSPAFLGGDAGDSFGSLMRVLASAFSSGAQWGYDPPLVAAASPVG